MTPAPPSDAELDTMIRARLAASGIDLDQLPPGTTPDPETGAPGRDTVLASLRSFVRGTVTSLAAYQPPAPDGSADPALSQQRAPMMYPSISVEWRR
ncbi:hypothetical protein [Nonomuraea aridisoli]|uniref:Uncharacterized protein n=1 Tax=Nonomuraea aridisoli TaxID=2070368 RepID=A0A2W2D534_9ACTN|nr:hypothetical protein [Nonomuraea aridisoli]PZG07152.1 hypothetical protein C1J01_41340 [Nonomuraea aridisoli]